MGVRVEWMDAKYTSVALEVEGAAWHGETEPGEEVDEEDAIPGEVGIVFGADEAVVLSGDAERVRALLARALRQVDEFEQDKRRALADEPCPARPEGGEHDWSLHEDGYGRTWATVVEGDKITAYFQGSEDWSEDGDGDLHLFCGGCMARRDVNEDSIEYL
ncbi:hypothetical protein ABRQ22_14825 [Cellulosimicrobium sp. ES-005]|uniref:DUF2262 domain-containing protein n=1 Tax=Cellulosimicrobium sp. ES-005 TaxID=3163031 RepID=A0AAU8FW95_9MICO